MVAARLKLVSMTILAVCCGEDILSINVAAIKDPDVGPRRLCRNFEHLVRTFGKGLGIAANNPIEAAIARAMQTQKCSNDAAREILSITVASAPKLPKQPVYLGMAGHQEQSDVSLDSADEAEEDEDIPAIEDVKIATDFLLDSEAYFSFKESLLDFANKPYEQRLLTNMRERIA